MYHNWLQPVIIFQVNHITKWENGTNNFYFIFFFIYYFSILFFYSQDVVWISMKSYAKFMQSIFDNKNFFYKKAIVIVTAKNNKNKLFF